MVRLTSSSDNAKSIVILGNGGLDAAVCERERFLLRYERMSSRSIVAVITS